MERGGCRVERGEREGEWGERGGGRRRGVRVERQEKGDQKRA